MEVRQAALAASPDVEGPGALEAPGHFGNRRCKIVCTLGPNCQDELALGRLLDAGVDACCLDFCQELREAHAESLRCLRRATAMRDGREVAVILDINGRQIRTGFFKDGPSVDLKAGSELKLVTDMSFLGDATCIAVDFEQLPSIVKPGDTILCADGSLALEVLSRAPEHVVARILYDHRLGERQNCWLPCLQGAPYVPEFTFRDLVTFGIPQNVDYVAMGCVRDEADVQHVREVLGERGSHIGVLARIGSEAGLENLDEIIRESDGIIVSRGDLSMQIPPEKVFLAQKAVIAKCNAAGKPVLVTSRLPESPSTSAEVSDAVNAVLDGADGLLFSDGAALGEHTEAAMSDIRRGFERTEAALDRSARHQAARALQLLEPAVPQGSSEAASLTAVEAAIHLRARLLLVLTRTGEIARMVSRLRPDVEVVAVTDDRCTARKLQVSHGINTLVVEDIDLNDAETAVSCVAKVVKQRGWIREGDVVVAVHEREVPQQSGDAEFSELEERDGESDGGSEDELDELICEVSTLVVRDGAVIISNEPLPVQEAEQAVDFPSTGSRVILEEDVAGLAYFPEADDPLIHRRCKVMCTVGPKSSSVDELLDLLDAGMDVCRLDSSHGDYAELSACARRLQEAIASRPERTVAVQLDVNGPDFGDGLRQLRQDFELQAVDFLALGRARDAADVRAVREAVGPSSQHVKILAKIETEVGLRNFDAILNESDGIVVVSSTLAMEVGAEKAIFAQKSMARKCNDAKKPVVITTPLSSMAQVPRPTQAEAADLANAVLDGADCVVLGEETVAGEFSEAAVELARRLCEEATEAVGPGDPVKLGLEAPVSHVAVEEARKNSAGLIMVACRSEEVVLEVAQLRPAVPIMAITWDEKVARRLNLVRGVVPFCVGAKQAGQAEEAAMLAAIAEARAREMVKDDEHIVLLRGPVVRVFEPLGVEDDCCLAGVRKLQLPSVTVLQLDLSGVRQYVQLILTDQPLRMLKRRLSDAEQPLRAFQRRLSSVASQAGVATVALTERLGLQERLGMALAATLSMGKAIKAQGEKLFPGAAQKAVNRELGMCFLSENMQRAEVVALASGLQYQVLRNGDGHRQLQPDGLCVCHYEGRVACKQLDCPAFISTYEQGEPAELRPDEVIAGCAEAMQMMVEGDKWEVYIPPELGYGDEGSPPAIAGGDVLIFTLEMLEFRSDDSASGEESEEAPWPEVTLPGVREVAAEAILPIPQASRSKALGKTFMEVDQKEPLYVLDSPVKDLADRIDRLCLEKSGSGSRLVGHDLVHSEAVVDYKEEQLDPDAASTRQTTPAWAVGHWNEGPSASVSSGCSTPICPAAPVVVWKPKKDGSTTPTMPVQEQRTTEAAVPTPKVACRL